MYHFFRASGFQHTRSNHPEIIDFQNSSNLLETLELFQFKLHRRLLSFSPNTFSHHVILEVAPCGAHLAESMRIVTC
jgi:hypothetical protein